MTTTRAAWRFRRCPSCFTVAAAGTFAVVGSYRPGWNETGTMRRRCPDCGHVGPSRDFQVVRERRAGGAT